MKIGECWLLVVDFVVVRVVKNGLHLFFVFFWVEILVQVHIFEGFLCVKLVGIFRVFLWEKILTFSEVFFWSKKKSA